MLKVLVIDDSAVVRQAFTALIGTATDMTLVTAADPLFARRKMDLEWPDVIVLDIEMPRMNGLEFLEQLMGERPTPVIICSSLAEKGARETLRALALGAVDIITKPNLNVRDFLEESHERLLAIIRSAAHARMRPAVNAARRPPTPVVPRDVTLRAPDRVIALGTSTGGTQALEFVLRSLPLNVPGILIVQHMPEKFTRSFADRLNELSALEVKEAENGDEVRPGRALVAPGNFHMTVERTGGRFTAKVADGPLVRRHRPSVDVLFRSLARTVGRRSMAVIMTGMGDDGAAGIQAVREAGGWTLAQDEASSVVYGMPAEAVKRGAVFGQLALEKIPEAILKFSAAESVPPV